MDEIKATIHGKQRIRDRMNLSKHNNRILRLAFEKGITPADTTGSLKKYLNKIYNATNIRIYNNKIFLFVDRLLITIFDLPTKYFETVNRIKRSKREVSNARNNIYSNE